ncbi:MAG: hypothetical protein ACYC27_20915 [Armatimonadota bacterium]
MKAKIVLTILFCIITAQACIAGNTSDNKVDLNRIAPVYIKKGIISTPISGIISGHEALIRIDRFLLLGLDPEFNSKTGEITLTSPKFRAKAKLGSTNITINGRREKLAVDPQILTVSKIALLAPEIYVPVLRIAKSLGYTVVDNKATIAQGRHFDIVSPCYHRQLGDFFNQTILSLTVQRSGDIEAKAKLTLGKDTDPILHMLRNYANIEITISNNGNKPFIASGEFVYLEKWDGQIFSTLFFVISQKKLK